MKNLIHWTEKGYLDAGFEAECKFLSTFDETFPFYHDHDYFEIFLLHGGSVLHTVNDRQIKLRKGTLVFIRPKDQHIYERDADHECQIINLAVRSKDMDALWAFLGPGFDAGRLLNAEMPPMVLLSVVENDVLTNRLMSLNTIPISHKNLFQTEMRITLLEIFSRYFSQYKTTPIELPEWLDRLISEMTKPSNFVEGTPALERLSFKSSGHLCRMFKKHLQKTPTQYVNELRLNYAANLLLRSDKKIITIAYDSGFENLSHFNHLFKNFFKQTPKQFRTQHRTRELTPDQ